MISCCFKSCTTLSDAVVASMFITETLRSSHIPHRLVSAKNFISGVHQLNKWDPQKYLALKACRWMTMISAVWNHLDSISTVEQFQHRSSISSLWWHLSQRSQTIFQILLLEVQHHCVISCLSDDTAYVWFFSITLPYKLAELHSRGYSITTKPPTKESAVI